MNFLRLAALDEEDLNIISAHVQDAVVRVGDIDYAPGENRLLMVMNRFVWENKQGIFRKHYERRRCALHFDRVKSVAGLAIDQKQRDRVLSLLALQFEETDAPAGFIQVIFSGNAALRIEVECIEVRLTDLGGAWEARRKPFHGV